MQLHFLPHFKTVPEPPPKEPEANFVRSRDVLQRDALNIASFNTMNAARRKQASFTGTLLGRDTEIQLTRRSSKAQLGIGPELERMLRSVHNEGAICRRTCTHSICALQWDRAKPTLLD